MAKLICITGQDGVGKNTLIDLLSLHLDSVCSVNIWDGLEASPSLFSTKQSVDAYLCSLNSGARLLFLAHALTFALEKALALKKEWILLNAYYYKYFATEAALGTDINGIKALTTFFPTPQKVLFLDLSVEMAATRKTNFSHYECGMSPTAKKEDFIEFQQKVSTFWNIFDQKKWAKLDASITPNELCVEALKIIQNE